MIVKSTVRESWRKNPEKREWKRSGNSELKLKRIKIDKFSTFCIRGQQVILFSKQKKQIKMKELNEIDPKSSDPVIIREKARTCLRGNAIGWMMIRGEILIELENSW